MGNEIGCIKRLCVSWRVAEQQQSTNDVDEWAGSEVMCDVMKNNVAVWKNHLKREKQTVFSQHSTAMTFPSARKILTIFHQSSSLLFFLVISIHGERRLCLTLTETQFSTFFHHHHHHCAIDWRYFSSASRWEKKKWRDDGELNYLLN